MMIDFTCEKCDASFELDAQDLIDGSQKIACPECRSKAPTGIAEDFGAALAELRAQVAAMSKKFSMSFSVETEDLEDLEDEDEEEPDEDDEDELDFDESEDEDEDFEEDEG